MLNFGSDPMLTVRSSSASASRSAAARCAFASSCRPSFASISPSATCARQWLSSARLASRYVCALPHSCWRSHRRPSAYSSARPGCARRASARRSRAGASHRVRGTRRSSSARLESQLSLEALREDVGRFPIAAQLQEARARPRAPPSAAAGRSPARAPSTRADPPHRARSPRAPPRARLRAAARPAPRRRPCA